MTGQATPTQILTALWPALAAIAHDLTAPVGHNRAEDLAQEGALRIIQLLADDPDLAHGYLIGAARHAMIDAYRKWAGRGRQVQRPVRLDVAVRQTYIEPGYAAAELAADLTRALDTLTPRERRLFILLIAGQPKQDIADRLGVSPSRISQLLRQARPRLAAVLDLYVEGRDHAPTEDRGHRRPAA